MSDPCRPGVVLLVDDDVLLLAGLQRALRGQPFNVRVAGRRTRRCRSCRRGRCRCPDHGPAHAGMSGTALLWAVRERFPDTARFMLTGRPDLAIAMEAIDSGAIHRSFVKPCDARRWWRDRERVARADDRRRGRMTSARSYGRRRAAPDNAR